MAGLSHDQELRLLEVAGNLGIGREALERQVRQADDPQALLQKLEERLARYTSEMFQNQDEEWYRTEADRARERHFKERELAEHATRDQRSQLSLGQRVDRVLRQAQTLTSAPVQQLGHISDSKPESRPPTAERGLLYDPAPDAAHGHYERLLRLTVEAAEREVDSQKRRPIRGERMHETTEEKDQRILKTYYGDHANLVGMLERCHPRSVERLRKRNGYNPTTGYYEGPKQNGGEEMAA